jgi:(2Fe-2S) ferredoxin
MATKKLPVFDVRVCEGRLCTAHRAGGLKEAAEAFLDGHPAGDRVRLSRGGCFGLCDLAANVVVRRYPSAGRLPPEDQDRLSLTKKKNETVYSGLDAAEVTLVLASHLEDDTVVERFTSAVREAERPPESPVAARMRELREKRERNKRARG